VRSSGSGRGSAVGTLFLARTVYAFNWYNIGALATLLESSFGIGSAEFGIVLGMFLLGAGIFQVPAGMAAMRWGNRATSIAALVVMGGFTLASAASPNWIVLAALRFGAGAGAALFFAPALGLVASYFPEGSRGPIIGLYNSGFSLGSGIGLILGALIGERFGWPWALAVGGIGLLASAAFTWEVLPPEFPARVVLRTADAWRSVAPALRSRRLWALALGTTGIWGAFYVAAQYFVAYAKVAHAGWPLAVAAAVPTTMIFAEIFGGPVGGWFGERHVDMRRIIVYWGCASGVLLAVVPWLGFVEVWPAFVFLGFADGVVFAVLYLIPSYLPEVRGERFVFGLATLNSIQIFLGSGIAIAFGFIAAFEGFWVAWVFAGATALLMLPLLILVGRISAAGREPRGSKT
jgi:predicted MFS family arabinose efflux permease